MQPPLLAGIPDVVNMEVPATAWSTVAEMSPAAGDPG